MRANAFTYAMRGLLYTFRHEANLRVHLAIAETVVYVGAVEGISATRWAALALAIALVLSLELLNTAIERAVDLTVGERRSPLAGAAKDVAAGAVLVGATGAAVVGIVVLGPGLGRFFAYGTRTGGLIGLGLLAAVVLLTFLPRIDKGRGAP